MSQHYADDAFVLFGLIYWRADHFAARKGKPNNRVVGSFQLPTRELRRISWGGPVGLGSDHGAWSVICAGHSKQDCCNLKIPTHQQYGAKVFNRLETFKSVTFQGTCKYD